MGLLVNGKWRAGGWATDKKGRFVREKTLFHDWVQDEAGARFRPEAGRYHLYVSLACPWAHRTLILRKLKQLTDVISLSIVDPFMGEEGWQFSKGPDCIPDTVNGTKFLREVYLKAKPDVSTRVTVPILWDKKEGTIVNNESREIMRMFDTEFDSLGNPEIGFYPRAQQTLIDERIDEIYSPINNGVYRAGFANSQEAYEEAVQGLFDALDHYEELLSRQAFLCGKVITEADWCFFTTLLRFDLVYHYHFKCNLKKISDYPYLWDYLRRLYRVPGVAETCNFGHIKEHYYRSHESINPSRIVPEGPENYLKRTGEDYSIYHGKYLNFKSLEGWEYVDRHNCKGAVIIVGITDDEKLILVEQYRIPLKQKVIEFPAGLVDDQPKDEEESWEAAAKREFLEETGYQAKEWKYLTQGPTTPGMSSELICLYLATGLKKIHSGGGDESESIEIHEVPLREAEDWLKKKEKAGEMVDTKVYAGLYFANKFLKEKKKNSKNKIKKTFCSKFNS